MRLAPLLEQAFRLSPARRLAQGRHRANGDRAETALSARRKRPAPLPEQALREHPARRLAQGRCRANGDRAETAPSVRRKRPALALHPALRCRTRPTLVASVAAGVAAHRPRSAPACSPLRSRRWRGNRYRERPPLRDGAAICAGCAAAPPAGLSVGNLEPCCLSEPFLKAAASHCAGDCSPARIAPRTYSDVVATL